ncbi:elongation factor Ts [Candidatus Omnitrophota bacterium]
MKSSLDSVRELRRITAASISDCNKALKDAKGDIKKAAELIRKRGLQIASKKSLRAANEGRIEAYVHLGNKTGVLLEVNCETDFVARNSDFCQFTKDVAMHIVACEPAYLSKKEVPAKDLKKEKNKEEFCKQNCLLEQAFVKDPSVTVKDLLTGLVAKTGENIVIRRFMRYRIGE